MELNREQIIKALECCQTQYDRNCNECPYERHKTRSISVISCESTLRKDLLSLIKELTEENERLRAEKKAENKELFYKWKKLADEAADRYEGLYQDAKKALVADTVRKMQHKIWLEFSDCTEEEKISVGSFRASVDQIAKEMLEGK